MVVCYNATERGTLADLCSTLGIEDILMTNYLKTLIDQEFTQSEQEAILVHMADSVGNGWKYEFYREPRNGKNVLMVRVYTK